MSIERGESAEEHAGDQDDSSRRLPTVGQWRDITLRMSAGLPLTEEDRRQFVAGQKAVAEAAQAIKDRFAGVFEQLRPIVLKVPDLLQQFADWQKAFAARFAPALAEMVGALKALPPRLQAALIGLGKNGWYLDPSMGFSELLLFEDLLSSGGAAQIDHILTEHFEARLDEIEESLVKALPNREGILRAAFRAHRRGEFELSVPILLAQADGVCLDMTGLHFFVRDRVTQRPASSAYVAGLVGNEVSSALLSPLATVLPINANPKERERMLQTQGMTDWRELNRHMVLHGESVDYGTRVNSLKAISLINYFVGFLGEKA